MNNIFKHVACRNNIYAKTFQRCPVPDEYISWAVNFDFYKPLFYESPGIDGKPWADPHIDDPEFKPKFNDIDGDINRVSYFGVYSLKNGMPLNPFGRTGIAGRGILGRFGPNHAADPIVSTWKLDENKQKVINEQSKKPVLRILCIKRSDTGEVALPGGMVDIGELVSETLKREFIEEALNGKVKDSEIADFFAHGKEVYKGYVDDPRNTDNG